MNKTCTDFFGLTDNPFKRTPDIDFYFTSPRHQEALNTLNHLLNSDEGFAVISGEPGTGKSITVRRFVQDLPRNTIFAYILFPNLTPEELFKAVLENFGVEDDETVSRNAMFSRFSDFLIEAKEEGKEVLIIIDEAQNMPIETLEVLRILSNLETDKEKLLKIALIGQPELVDKLDSNELRQLKQRISLYASLQNLTLSETVNYMNFRVERAGRSSLRISPGVGKRVWRTTHGNPRLVNTLMSRAIMAAFLDDSHVIKPLHIYSALKSINTLGDITIRKSSPGQLVAACVLVLAIALGGMYYKFFYKPVVLPPVALVDLPSVAPTPVELPPAQDPQAQEPDPVEPVDLPPVEDPVVPADPDPIVPDPVPVDPDPVATPPMFGVNSIVVVRATALNVRAQPLLNAERVGMLYESQRLVVREESVYWVRVDMPDGREGWVNKEYLRPE